MIELFIFWAIGTCGILAFTAWGLTRLIKKRMISKRRMVIKFHSQGSDGKVKVTEVPVDCKDYFNISPKDLKCARKYVREAIKNGELKIGTTLEQSYEFIKKERAKDEEENGKA